MEQQIETIAHVQKTEQELRPAVSAGKVTDAEQREAILEVLCIRRHDTYRNLAFEFQVSRETIRQPLWGGFLYSLVFNFYYIILYDKH